MLWAFFPTSIALVQLEKRELIPTLSWFQASILRQIVAGPRLQHPETGLDLCYVTDFRETLPRLDIII